MTVVLVLLALICVGLGAYIVVSIHRMQTPTAGPAIDRAARPNDALIVVDVQSDFTRRTGKHAYAPDDVDTKIRRINEEAALSELKGSPVVSVRQVLKEPVARAAARLLVGTQGLAGSPDPGLDDRLDLAGSADFEKSRGDAFSSDQFSRWLERNRVGALRIIGLDGCHCVQHTARGALNRGYDVTVVDDCVMTAFPDRWETVKEDLEALGAEIENA